MDPAQVIVRRANLDDLTGLKELWQRTGLQVLEMERHLTEFQLASTRDGDLLGAIALRVARKEGFLHSEAFVQAEQEDEYRPLIWERFRTLARNHGLVRLWTQEQAPFYAHNGFAEATHEKLAKLPKEFGDPAHRWWVLQLREEAPEVVSAEKELELFHQTSRAGVETMLSQARRLRAFAYGLGIVLFIAFTGFGGYLLLRWMRQSGAVPSRRR